ncbi:hypothetical protein QR680_014548 [Steinernema hermaphroditum]|uniref:Peptidase M13 N-terminal domain-containing protein n=1 Tax=Steinernema hermaphroditum TaxID=289476 RepID=A0AA39IBF1_9BILA|nr:hypothetical protein QR680_014548 [Steinernema hermaphroditum]
MIFNFALILCFLAICPSLANVVTRKVDHIFSSNVHPCDDFHDFVCNKEGRGELSPLLKELKNGFYSRLRNAFIHDDDTIVREFMKIYAGSNASFDVEIPDYGWNARRKLRVTYTDQTTNVKKEHDLVNIEYYLNLLYAKYIIEKDLNPQTWKDEMQALFEEVKSEVIDTIRAASWMPTKNKTEIESFLNEKRLHLGLPAQLEDVTLINNAIYKVRKRFIQMKQEWIPGTNCDKNCLLEYYSSFLKTAYEESVPHQVAYHLRVLNRYIIQNTFTTCEYGNYSNYLYMSPVLTYQPRSPIAKILKYFESTVSMSSLLFDDLQLNWDKSEGFSCYQNLSSCEPQWYEYQRNVDIIEGLRLASKIIAKKSAAVKFLESRDEFKSFNFSDLQWFFVQFESIWCQLDDQPTTEGKENSPLYIRQSPEFQMAFGCKSGHELYTRQEDMCYAL